MKTLVIGATKGGVGKTTLAAHLAVAARERLAEVAIIDCDRQRSLADWYGQRADLQPALVPIEGGLRQTLARLADEGHGLAIVDCPPGQPATIATAIALADLVVIPTQSSPTDLRAIGPTVDIAEHAGTPYVFVLNRVVPRTKLAEQAVEALHRHGRLAGIVHQRVDFAASMTDGRTAGEMRPRGKASAEMAELWRTVERLLLDADPAATTEEEGA